MDEIENIEEIVEITPELEKEIEKKVASLKAENPTARVIFPIVIEGNPDYDDKEYYVAYFRQPDFKTFSKYLSAASNNNAVAMRTLAKDCFLGGDEEMIKDDSMFLFGTMGQLGKIIEMRNGRLVNLSKTRK